MKKLLIPFVFICFGSWQAWSQNSITQTIEINNVRAYVSNNGLLFNNIPGLTGGFEAPKGPFGTFTGKNVIYASTLWLGGIDPGGNARVSAQTYRQMGNDFKGGPFETVVARSYPASTEDSLWKVTKADYLAAKNGTPTTNVKNWPYRFKDAQQQWQNLAPYADENNDGIMNGKDYPVFPGDEAIFFVYNDNITHTETSSLPLGVEIKGFVYQMKDNANEFINNTTFVDYYITNKSTNEYKDFVASVWTDFDLGDYADDRVGTDSVRNMYYCYNGTDTDKGPVGYGNKPPAVGVMFLNKPMHVGMTNSNDFSITGNPTKASEFYTYMNAIWKDGKPLTTGGNGYNTGSPTKYAFSGNPCANTGWTEDREGLPFSDKRVLGSVQLDVLKPGQVQKISVAYLWAQSQTGGAKGSLCKMFSQADSLRNWYSSGPPLSTNESVEKGEIKIYPNPATSTVNIEVAGNTEIKVGIFDMAGRQVITAKGNSIDVSGLAKGLYIVKVQAGDNYYSKKLIVE